MWGASCVHGSVEVLKSVLLLLLASLKERRHNGYEPYVMACGWSNGTALGPVTAFRLLACALPRLLPLTSHQVDN